MGNSQDVENNHSGLQSRGSTSWLSGRHSQTPSQSSEDLVDLDGIRLLAFGQLCDFIQKHPSVKAAGVVSCSCYAEKAFPVTHRFLILQLQLPGNQDVWLRLDRRPSKKVGAIAFFLALGTTPSNDQAAVSACLEPLLWSPATRENEIIFENSSYPVQRLRSILIVILVVMNSYKLTSENCWGFCSLLQEVLSLHEHSRIVIGQISHTGYARKARAKIFQILHLEHTLAPRVERPSPLISPPEVAIESGSFRSEQNGSQKVPLDNSVVFARFQEINRQTLELCNEAIPVIHSEVFARLLTIINSHLFDVFDAFHPHLPKDEDLKWKAKFYERASRESPFEVELARRRAFSHIENQISVDLGQNAQLIEQLTTSICVQISPYFQESPLSQSQKKLISEIIENALDWNTSVKGSRCSHIWRVIKPSIEKPFDPTTCIQFSATVSTATLDRIVGIVSLGIEVSEFTKRKALSFCCPVNGKAVVICGNARSI